MCNRKKYLFRHAKLQHVFIIVLLFYLNRLETEGENTGQIHQLACIILLFCLCV